MATEMRALPAHIGIIMDGNGRWAKAHKVPRVMGHNAGTKALKTIVIKTAQMGVGSLTVYAFSTENWKRSVEEVSGIFKLIIKFVNSELEELIENNVHINIFGDYSMLPEASIKSVDKLVAKTSHCDGLNLNIALNYGGRDEILKAVKEIAGEVASGAISADDITEDMIGEHLYSGKFNIPDPDLIIRTSGEERTSNFLVWQSAYSELMFTDTLWPDFTPEEYELMIERYMRRDRRFGGRNEEDE